MTRKWRGLDLDNLDELTATIETIKLWKFLSEDGDKDKEDYFCTEKEYVNSGCFLCEYYRDILPAENTRKYHPCIENHCPLRFNHLCCFASRRSAYWLWMTETDAEVREEYAERILKAALMHYKKLTGEKYHE